MKRVSRMKESSSELDLMIYDLQGKERNEVQEMSLL